MLHGIQEKIRDCSAKTSLVRRTTMHWEEEKTDIKDDSIIASCFWSLSLTTLPRQKRKRKKKDREREREERMKEMISNNCHH